jgi:hypothetical protein
VSSYNDKSYVAKTLQSLRIPTADTLQVYTIVHRNSEVPRDTERRADVAISMNMVIN